jgi:hypothetical protein
MDSSYNTTINLTYVFQSVGELENELDVQGTLISYKNNIFIISVHFGYPIESIKINNEIYKNFIICAWCDLIIIPYKMELNIYTFKHFVKKQMEPTDKYFSNDSKLKFINNVFMEIGMIPNNPTIMYNVLKSIGNVTSGAPIYNEKNKLVGIISRFENIDMDINNVYCIPVNYILHALNKMDNTKIYSLNENIEEIVKINNYKIVCGKIYCILHKTYIPIARQRIHEFFNSKAA